VRAVSGRERYVLRFLPSLRRILVPGLRSNCDDGVQTQKEKKKTRGAYSIYRSPACKESLPRNPEVQLWLREQKNGDFWMWKYKRDKKK
jgi:hypothetical protein